MTRGPVHVFQRALSNKFNYCSDCEAVLSFKRFTNTRYSWQKSRKMLQTGPKVIKYNFAVKKNSFLQTCFNWMGKWLTKLNYFNSWTSVQLTTTCLTQGLCERAEFSNEIQRGEAMETECVSKRELQIGNTMNIRQNATFFKSQKLSQSQRWHLDCGQRLYCSCENTISLNHSILTHMRRHANRTPWDLIILVWTDATKWTLISVHTT